MKFELTVERKITQTAVITVDAVDHRDAYVAAVDALADDPSLWINAQGEPIVKSCHPDPEELEL